jgi:hypothetical protein
MEAVNNFIPDYRILALVTYARYVVTSRIRTERERGRISSKILAVLFFLKMNVPGIPVPQVTQFR